MSIVMRAFTVGLLLSLGGCATANQPPRADLSPAALAGSYRLTGRIDGTRISSTVRVDERGRVTLLATSPNGTHRCEASALRVERLVAQCGPVELQLSVDDRGIARTGRLAFDKTRRTARREADPFPCIAASDQICQMQPQAAPPLLQRAYGRVNVARIATTD
jgi:hypothetical protein